MNTTSLKKYILFTLTIILFAACDQDFNGIGTDIIGDDNFEITKIEPSVVAFNQNLGPVQSNNLPINALGIYNNTAFGETTANFATQVVLQTVNPTIDPALKPVIESVILYIPYFTDATKTTTNTDGDSTYTLDSIYGPKDAKIKLGVYESGYFMRDFDPATQDGQVYYSNQNGLFDNVKGQRLNNGEAAQNDEFVFSDAEYKEETKDSDGKVTSTVRTAPGMRLNLDINFFKSKILEAPSGKLATNDVFKNYFRGLYFKVEKSGTYSQLALINFSKGTITIKYKENKSLTETDEKDRVSKSIVLNLTGNSVNLFQNNYLPSYSNGIASPNTSEGDSKLYLKGGEGSMAVVDLFGKIDEYKYDVKKDVNGNPIDENGNIIPLDQNGNPINGFLIYIRNSTPNGIADELDDIRHPKVYGSEIYYSKQNKWLINDASLTFTIDAAAMKNDNEPNRIYLYDLNNKRQLLDYSLDASIGKTSKLNKTVHGGIIEEVEKKGTRYKIRLTNHIRNLISNDTITNVKLGLVVTENINDVSNKKLATPISINGVGIKQIPTSSVINPLGTVLFGTNPKPEDQDKKLKFEIYYTKPN